MINASTYDFERVSAVNSGGPLSDARYIPFIARVMEKIHSRIPRDSYNGTKAAAPVDYREEYFEGRNHRRAVLFLLSNGCEWAIKGAHGCTMCGHLAKQTKSLTPLSSEDYISQFMGALETIDFQETPILNLYNNGSFFNERELPVQARIRMLKEINRNKDIRMVVLETRPEFVTEEVMEQTRALLPDTHVEVAMGLETMNDLKRMISVNKGFTLKRYEQAVRIIRQCQIHARSYVLLKPLFFSEKEGIGEAIQTIGYAFRSGASTVSLEGCTYQKYTLTEYLVDNGLYRLPKLWSILDVVQKTHHLGKLVTGLFQFYPSPDHVPYNCDRCSDRVLDAIKEYNRTLRVEAFEGLDCECKRDWEYELQNANGSFQQRLVAFRKKAMEDGLLGP